MSLITDKKGEYTWREDEPEYNQGAYDDGFDARLIRELPLLSCPSVEETSPEYVRSWKAGWVNADLDIQQGKVEEFRKTE